MNKCYIFITDNKIINLHFHTNFYFAIKLKYKLIIYVLLFLKLLAELATTAISCRFICFKFSQVNIGIY